MESNVLVVWLRGLSSKMATLFSSPDQDYVYKPNAVITDQGDFRNSDPSSMNGVCSRLYTMFNCIARSGRSQYQQHDILKYLANSYFGPSDGMMAAVSIQKHWTTYYRHGVSYSLLDTKNYIEYWHNALKRHYLRDRHQRRYDTAIYIRMFMAFPQFSTKKFKRRIIQLGRMNPLQKFE